MSRLCNQASAHDSQENSQQGGSHFVPCQTRTLIIIHTSADSMPATRSSCRPLSTPRPPPTGREGYPDVMDKIPNAAPCKKKRKKENNRKGVSVPGHHAEWSFEIPRLRRRRKRRDSEDT